MNGQISERLPQGIQYSCDNLEQKCSIPYSVIYVLKVDSQKHK